jgi:adenylate cyclase
VAGHELGFGIGIARGETTLGRIGFDSRLDYAAIGRIPNLAARLCAQALAGQILVSDAVYRAIDGRLAAERVGDLALKGFQEPIPAFAVLRREAQAADSAA